MKTYAYYTIIPIFILVFAFGTQATNVMIDPPTSDISEVGEALTVNVKIDDVTGLFGYQLDLAFDNTALKFSSIQTGEFLGNDGSDTLTFLKIDERQIYFGVAPDIIALLEATGQSVESDITSDIAAEISAAGKLTVVGTRLGSDMNIDGTGILLTATFEALEVKESELELENVELGSSVAESGAQLIPADVQNGGVVVPEIKGDINNDGSVGSDDAVMALKFAVGLETPDDYQSRAADMNNDGRIGADDTILILRKAIGLAAPPVDIAANTGFHITLALAEAHGVAGESMTMPLEFAGNIHAASGGEVEISYDQRILRAVNVLSDPGVILASNINNPGIVHIAFVKPDDLNKANPIRIQFDILADDTSPLTLKTLNLYSSDALPLISRGIDGKFASWAIPPEKNALLQNFPNPFNPDTWIPYQLTEDADISITIYDATGRIIRRLDLGNKPAGIYQTQDRAAHWDGRNTTGEVAASGIYFAAMKAGSYHAVRSIVLVR